MEEEEVSGRSGQAGREFGSTPAHPLPPSPPPSLCVLSFSRIYEDRLARTRTRVGLSFTGSPKRQGWSIIFLASTGIGP